MSKILFLKHYWGQLQNINFSFNFEALYFGHYSVVGLIINSHVLCEHSKVSELAQQL